MTKLSRLKMETTTIQNLPHDTVLEILYKLSVRTLIRCSLVCKHWFKTINDPSFAATHALQSSQRYPRLMFKFVQYHNFYDPLDHTNQFFYLEKDSVDLHEIATIKNKNCKRKLVGYCNGLVCFYMNQIVEVYNPSRREIFGVFPPFQYKLRIDGYGFGFDFLTNEYKLVGYSTENKYLVLTLGSNSWREIEGPDRLLWDANSSIFCKDTLYWRTIGVDEEMVSFDLHNETFQVIPLPPECQSRHDKKFCYMEIEGCLCIARLDKPAGSQNCTVYLNILKDKLKLLWVKETILLPFSPPTELFRNNRVNACVTGFSDQVLLCWVEAKEGLLKLYDLHKKDLKVVKCPGNRSFNSWSVNQVENVLCLKTFQQNGDRGLFYFEDSYHPFKLIPKTSTPTTTGVFVALRSRNTEPRSAFYF